MMDLFVNLLTAHLLADFPLQKDAWIRNKQERRLRGFGIWKHSVVVLLTTILALGFSEYIYLWVAIGMTIIHVAIDYLKVKFTKNDLFEKARNMRNALSGSNCNGVKFLDLLYENLHRNSTG